ncbi:uncharacterized protein LOC108666124 isoform X1 [Hyalella azteca]|uniref:Uncharacterized protein LOC108666124 isoform X1 n=1 Tax=Hyalella azteca TaxID=294128 RepID=A0A979FMF8_HYAAZ|nr:uncharacterized protein LOC108666124 isoform X1 [Hyalella azteca]
MSAEDLLETGKACTFYEIFGHGCSKPEYKISGYLGKLSSHQKSWSQLLANTAGEGIVKTLIHQRWMVFSELTCKLFCFKDKDCTQYLGAISIASATFNYDPEDPHGIFSILCDGETHYFAAGDDSSRQWWLESLQEGKVRFMSRCQEDGASTTIQWYTSLPSSPPPELSRSKLVDVLQSSKSKVALGLRASAKKLSPHAIFNNPEKTKAFPRTLSHESLNTGKHEVILRDPQFGGRPERPRTVHLLEHSQDQGRNGLVSNGRCECIKPSNGIKNESSLSEDHALPCPISSEAESYSFQLRPKNFSKSFRSHFSAGKTEGNISKMSSRGTTERHNLQECFISPTTSAMNVCATPSPSSETFTGFRQIGADLKASLSSIRRSSKRSSMEAEAAELGSEASSCGNCSQLRRALAATEDRLTARTEELQAAKEGIELLQQDLALLYRQRQTSSRLDEVSGSDEHLLEILREKDRALVEFEQSDCRQKNEIAELRQQTRHLSEQVDLLSTLVKAKDNAIRSISDELQEFKTSHAVAGRGERMCSFLDASVVNMRCPLQSSAPPFIHSERNSEIESLLSSVAEEPPASAPRSDLQGSRSSLAPTPGVRRNTSPQTVFTNSSQILPRLVSGNSKKPYDRACSDSAPELSNSPDLVTDLPSAGLLNADTDAVRGSCWSGRLNERSHAPTNAADVASELNRGPPHFFTSNAEVEWRSGRDHLVPGVKSLRYDHSAVSGRDDHSAVSVGNDVQVAVVGVDLGSDQFDVALKGNPRTSAGATDSLTRTPPSGRSNDLDSVLPERNRYPESCGQSSAPVADLDSVLQEKDRYQESYLAYKAQNAFLHKQIVDLSRASDFMKQREERIRYECSVWEARYQRVHSKYLVLCVCTASVACGRRGTSVYTASTWCCVCVQRV